MARMKWVATLEKPEGEMVPLTPEEEAQRDLDEAEHARIVALPKPKSMEERLVELEAEIVKLKETKNGVR